MINYINQKLEYWQRVSKRENNKKVIFLFILEKFIVIIKTGDEHGL